MKRAPKKAPKKAAKSQPASEGLVIADGLVMFTFSGEATINGKQGAFDTLTVRLASEPIEKKHEVREGWSVTPEFALDIYDALKAIGMPIMVETGEPYCTPSVAVGVWRAALEKHVAGTQKKTESEPK